MMGNLLKSELQRSFLKLNWFIRNWPLVRFCPLIGCNCSDVVNLVPEIQKDSHNK